MNIKDIVCVFNQQITITTCSANYSHILIKL